MCRDHWLFTTSGLRWLVVSCSTVCVCGEQIEKRSRTGLDSGLLALSSCGGCVGSMYRSLMQRLSECDRSRTTSKATSNDSLVFFSTLFRDYPKRVREQERSSCAKEHPAVPFEHRASQGHYRRLVDSPYPFTVRSVHLSFYLQIDFRGNNLVVIEWAGSKESVGSDRIGSVQFGSSKAAERMPKSERWKQRWGDVRELLESHKSPNSP